MTSAPVGRGARASAPRARQRPRRRRPRRSLATRSARRALAAAEVDRRDRRASGRCRRPRRRSRAPRPGRRRPPRSPPVRGAVEHRERDVGAVRRRGRLLGRGRRGGGGGARAAVVAAGRHRAGVARVLGRAGLEHRGRPVVAAQHPAADEADDQARAATSTTGRTQLPPAPRGWLGSGEGSGVGAGSRSGVMLFAAPLAMLAGAAVGTGDDAGRSRVIRFRPVAPTPHCRRTECRSLADVYTTWRHASRGRAGAHAPALRACPGGRHEMPDGVHSTTETTAVISPGEDLARALAEPAAAWPDVVLREHQLEALDELAGRLQHGATRTWVDAPTGSGKTIMFLALAAGPRAGAPWCSSRGATWPSRPIAGLARHFTAVHANPEGPDAAGKPGVTVCTYQAALRHQDRMDWDVGHAADLRRGPRHPRRPDAQAARPGARTRWWSASPPPAPPPPATSSRSSARSPPPSTGCRPSSAASSARCAPCAWSAPSTSRTSPGCAATSTRPASDAPSTGPAGTAPAPTSGWSTSSPLKLAGVAYTATVAQAHALAEELTERGVRAAAVSGQTPARELQRVLFDFASERIDVLCNADLLTEGWDETRAAVVMHLAPTTSERVFVQRLGRVMRPAPDKEAVSVEFLPVGRPDGRPDQPRGLRPRLVQAARPRGRAARGGRARQAGQGGRACWPTARATRPSWSTRPPRPG